MARKALLPFTVLLVFYIAPYADKAAAQAVFPEQNGKALTGLREVDVIVQVVTWLSMDGDRSLLEQNVQFAFELALRRDGLIVTDKAPNFLFCSLSFALAGGIIVYKYSVEFFSFELTDVHRLLWRGGGIVTVGRARFDAEQPAKDCADRFAREWLRWNPR